MDVKEWIPTILQLLLVVFSSAMIINQINNKMKNYNSTIKMCNGKCIYCICHGFCHIADHSKRILCSVCFQSETYHYV